MEILLGFLAELLFEIAVFLGIDFIFWWKGKKNRLERKKAAVKFLDIWNILFYILTALIFIYGIYKVKTELWF